MGCSHDACFTTCYGWYIDERGWFISYIFRVHYHHHELAITTVIKWEFIIWITTPGLRSLIQLKLYRYSQLFTTSLHHKMQSNGPSAIAWPWDIWECFVSPKTCMSQIKLLSLLCWTKFWAILSTSVYCDAKYHIYVLRRRSGIPIYHTETIIILASNNG